MATVGVHDRQFVEAPVSPTIPRSHHDGLVIDFGGFVERDYAGVGGRSREARAGAACARWVTRRLQSPQRC